jgi:hypothetical protein
MCHRVMTWRTTYAVTWRGCRPPAERRSDVRHGPTAPCVLRLSKSVAACLQPAAGVCRCSFQMSARAVCMPPCLLARTARSAAARKRITQLAASALVPRSSAQACRRRACVAARRDGTTLHADGTQTATPRLLTPPLLRPRVYAPSWRDRRAREPAARGRSRPARRARPKWHARARARAPDGTDVDADDAMAPGQARHQADGALRRGGADAEEVRGGRAS